MQQPETNSRDSEGEPANLGSSRHNSPSLMGRLANSAGFWMVVFSLFGLLSLSLNEARIQKRMLKQQLKTALPYPAASTGGDTSTAAGPSSVNKSDTSNLLNPKDLPPYRLTGLRWILWIATIAGVFVLIRDLRFRGQFRGQ